MLGHPYVVAIVCHCLGVSERKVRRAVDRGASTIADVGASCGAGTSCGGCHPNLEQLLRSVDDVAVDVGMALRPAV